MCHIASTSCSTKPNQAILRHCLSQSIVLMHPPHLHHLMKKVHFLVAFCCKDSFIHIHIPYPSSSTNCFLDIAFHILGRSEIDNSSNSLTVHSHTKDNHSNKKTNTPICRLKTILDIFPSCFWSA